MVPAHLWELKGFAGNAVPAGFAVAPPISVAIVLAS